MVLYNHQRNGGKQNEKKKSISSNYDCYTWEEAKKIEKKIFKGRMEMTVPEADNNVVSISLWQKGSCKRIYFNDYKRRTVGYIDCVSRAAHYMDGYARMYVPAIDRFMEEYEF